MKEKLKLHRVPVFKKGKDYQKVVDEFESSGFTNIKLEKLDDLVTGWLTKDGEVESVSVDGDTGYSADAWYPADVEVIITYHTFPEKKLLKQIANPFQPKSLPLIF